MPKVLNITSETLLDDLVGSIKSGGRISVASACFSIYAFQALKEQLQDCEELRFVFTSPTFISERTPKERREFYIPRLNRERSLYGTEFEIKLRNELKQKAIAQECAEWIRNKARFKSINSQNGINNYMVVESDEPYLYLPINEFTTVNLGMDNNRTSNAVTRIEAPASLEYLGLFDSQWNDRSALSDVTDEVISMISAVYQENSPELIYYFALYNIFSEYLNDISEDTMPNEATGFKSSAIWNKLFNFQKDAALAIINKLEQYNGCILADSVGLGKTFTALAVIKYYECRNRNVLVLCPKKLANNWNTYNNSMYINNPLGSDRFRYDVFFHTDLSRTSGESNGKRLEMINWGNYDLVVIDESHNFRNGYDGTQLAEGRENRYARLMNQIIRPGVKTKVLMLSATPVNNRFRDLKNQLALAYEGDPEQINDKLNIQSDIDSVFRQAQGAFNTWSNLPVQQRTTQELLSRLSNDFFTILDNVTIARSRKHIKNYYDISEIGTFPERLRPISLRPELTELRGAIYYDEVYDLLSELNLSIYTPIHFVKDNKITKYLKDETEGIKFGREIGIMRLMRTNLLKRLESSVYSFRLTLVRIKQYMEQVSNYIDNFSVNRTNSFIDSRSFSVFIPDLDDDDQNDTLLNSVQGTRIDLNDMHYQAWQREIDDDIEILEKLIEMADKVTPEHDNKLQTLVNQIKSKVADPINPGNKKVLIFTAFADTAQYLYNNISNRLLQDLGLNTALITGTINGKTTIADPRFRSEVNHILSCFSPVSKERDIIYPGDNNDIDILIATDCISEGQNLQDCDYCINYDIHWNPVRIIQRFGRIDRIGSQNEHIQLVNFWPAIELDEYINLKNRVEARMKIAIMSATGDDDLVNQEEQGDLEYRREQLERLMNEVVDLEDMTNGISIMDLGLNDFKMDLVTYQQQHGDLEHVPYGIHAVVKGDKPGVIFVLKNIHSEVNIKNQNRLHPYYLVYVGADGSVVTDHLKPKDILDTMRLLSKGKTAPLFDVCRAFNEETDEGRDMSKVSELLNKAVESIIDVKTEKDIQSLFRPGGTSMLSGLINSLDDFELITFMVVRQ